MKECNSITGRELRTIASGSGPNDLVFFRDKDGKIHDIYTAMRTRYDGIQVTILMEQACVDKDFDLKVTLPPQEMIDYINKHFD